ncbi:glycosyl transferase family 2 [Striga asiatica]|uniref:Glycosyl transferase family 2 n=1 Tax=Striga asiatica TaxID=4170 RepID=A0A5A7QCM7_STRAF|nr:glycosyl transferase family 2 [Striga asiatica]
MRQRVADEALLEKTAKLTPPSLAVAPKGAGRPERISKRRGLTRGFSTTTVVSKSPLSLASFSITEDLGIFPVFAEDLFGIPTPNLFFRHLRYFAEQWRKRVRARRIFTRRQITAGALRNHGEELVQTHPGEPPLVAAEKPYDLPEEVRVARQGQAAGGREPEFLLRLTEEGHEHGQVQEPGGDDEPGPLTAHVDRDGTGRRPSGRLRRVVVVGAAAREAFVLPAADDLPQPHDLGDHVYFPDG